MGQRKEPPPTGARMLAFAYVSLSFFLLGYSAGWMAAHVPPIP